MAKKKNQTPTPPLDDEPIDGEARELPGDPRALVESAGLIPYRDDIPVLASQHPVLMPIVESLLAKTPTERIRTRQGGGGRYFDYAPWSYYAERLTKIFGPLWSTEILERDLIELPPLPPKHDRKCTKPGRGGNPDIVKCINPDKHVERLREELLIKLRLSTPWGKQETYGSHIYFPNNPEQTKADALQAARSQALKRCASNWGIGLDLYDDGVGEDPDEEAPKNNDDPAIPDARAAWRSAVLQAGLVEDLVLPLMSMKVSDNPDDLPTIDDVAAALGEGADGYWKAIALRPEVVEEETKAKETDDGK